MFNFSQASITLRAEKDMPAQLMFLRISEPLKKADLYGSKSTDYSNIKPIPCRERRSDPSLAR